MGSPSDAKQNGNRRQGLSIFREINVTSLYSPMDIVPLWKIASRSNRSRPRVESARDVGVAMSRRDLGFLCWALSAIVAVAWFFEALGQYHLQPPPPRRPPKSRFSRA